MSNATWISVASGASGSGNGTVTLNVAANTATTTRTGTVTIAGKTFTVVQAAAELYVQLVPDFADCPGKRRRRVHGFDNDERVRVDHGEHRELDYVCERQQRNRQRDRDVGRRGEHRDDFADQDGDHCGPDVHGDSERHLWVYLDPDFDERAGDRRVGKHICDGQHRLRLDSRERSELDYHHERRERERQRCCCLRYGAQHPETGTDRHAHGSRTDSLRHSGGRAKGSPRAEKSEDRELSLGDQKRGLTPFLIAPR